MPKTTGMARDLQQNPVAIPGVLGLQRALRRALRMATALEMTTSLGMPTGLSHV
jgi:Na+-transporting NADH:ubiquinone oxidoreductase subunit NqrD